MTLDAIDEQQLLGATAHGRCIFTFNVRDFMALRGDIHVTQASSWRRSRAGRYRV
jgi:hypothetical protein